MKRFAFIRRRLVEQAVWVEAETAKEARRMLGDGRSVDETDDERTMSLTLRRAPDQDQDPEIGIEPMLAASPPPPVGETL